MQDAVVGCTSNGHIFPVVDPPPNALCYFKHLNQLPTSPRVRKVVLRYTNTKLNIIYGSDLNP
jgi:hypothetical protein